MSNETSDLSAVLAENVALAAECESIKAENAALESSLKTEMETNALLIAENASLKLEKSALSSEKEKMKAYMSDFNKRVAAEVVKHGIARTIAKVGKHDAVLLGQLL